MSDNLRAALAHVRGLASGEGGDEASRNDPWNALATIVVVCDDALASPASSEPDGEAWTDVPGHGDRQFLVGQSEPSEPGSLAAPVRLRFGQEVILDCGPAWGGDHTLYVGYVERSESLSVNGGFVSSGSSREYVLQDGMDAGWGDPTTPYRAALSTEGVTR